MKSRGISLLWTLSLTALFFALALAAALRLDQARDQVQLQVNGLRARTLAASGCRFARAQLSQGLWKGNEVFHSPEMDGSFDLHLRRSGLSVSIVCRGRSGKIEFEQRSHFP
ncbi:hypothetical protein JST97_11505 [bacterium]|nr:hypothetical protein [bacterium]